MKNLRYLLLVVLLLSISKGLNSQVITTFTPVYQVTQKGGIVYLANSSIGCAVNPPIASASSCSNGVTQVPPSGSYKDNDFNGAYIDIDGDGTTVSSSSDSLNLPACSQISKAYIFWGACGRNTTNKNNIKVKINSGSYSTVTASYSQTNTAGFDTYHCYADITSLLLSGGINCRVTVADVKSSEIGNSNIFGSWCIAVVYKNDLKTMRQLTIFNGLSNVNDPGNTTVNVPITGFLTPLTGSVTLEVGLYTHDGDRGSTGDALKFKGASAFQTFTDAVNPSNDAMNSTVAYGGTVTPFRKPNMPNTAGLDADIFTPNNSTKNFIGNAATSATFQMTTGGETYLTQMVTTAIDVYEPDLRASITATDVNGGTLVPGDIIQYRIKGVNIGSDPSVNTYIIDTLDIRAEYIPNSTKVTFGASGTGTMTDGSGDDFVDYNASTRVLKIRIGSGANATTGGTVQNSPAGVDSTIVTYSVQVTSSCVKIACSNTIFARAYIYGTGATSTNTYNNGSNPGIFDSFGCPIPGTTQSPITATICTTPSASNTGPACLGGTLALISPTDVATNLTYSWSGPGGYSASTRTTVLSAFVASMAGVYTNTQAVPNSTCQQVLSTTVVANNCPIPVNDATNTAQGTSVSGNAGANDGNSTGATFSITGQPSGGTLTIGSGNGQYTFTPSTSFTGVTTGTYQICNGTPLTCEFAVITITVFPTLTANIDAVNTTPSVSVSGTLTTNDNGISTSLGGTYTVSVTQPSSSTGTITVNGTTGQYTFVPNPSFTGTTSTTYTICNTALNPTVCSSTTININVKPNPVAVNDATNTVINTTVSGNAAANDSGTLTGTYSITGQPTGGTVTINSATGQYTFTPASSFTGVTTATYQLCNGAPVTCSTAVINVTVYPLIAANTDTVNTTPSVTATGSLLTNDNGIVTNPGANYSVTVTQLPSGTGTITVNPTTGQYTFVPNPSYTGTTLTTYTVCNTSVNPQVCSNATININVKPNPVPVNDATTTVINTTVVANAAANDSGTLTGVFSITGQPSNGTVTINPTTGQYTFTPASSFTGVTTATYQLCNGAPVTCSTAVISVSVYPLIAANTDTINTTPSVTATGSLLTNDNGIVTSPGANYSVTVTQLPSGTGTITVNPTTGQYTFVPNPSYTGTTLTTYTVCNMSVNPQVCSNATININVKPNPVPVNDATTTVINTTVVANAAANDSGTLTGVFSITGQPTNGTVTINPTTGQYTFTPASSFTGVTTATYQLCNGAPVTCSTAVISVSVYPLIAANTDTINTTPSVTATGTLLTNDNGIVTSPGANYSVTVTQLPSGTGTITVNPSTGQYTFTPNPSYAGTTITTYTVCNTSVNPQICSNATININVKPNPVAVNDATNTIINTPVSGNAAANDSGTLTGVYSITGQPTNGTVTINPSTGQYTFTPASSFTGVTTATYQLCNGAPITCSTAVITVTVYPMVVANTDTVVTTNTAQTTGTLTSNDNGIVPGGSYSVSITQPSSSTGTFVINPTTGQYTFIPNSGFTGTTSTTYTLCNISVNPVVCTATTIILRIGDFPLANNDATVTMINTPVTGSLGTNDQGTGSALNPTFTVTQPANGTITVTSTNGQYTFTPSSGFVGTVSTTYTLCNLLGSCSSATITFSVYPVLTAVDDIVNTTPSVAVTGTLLSNDLGIVTSPTLSANYSVTVTQPASSVGVIVVDPTTGQYTFTPASGFVGNTQTTYTVCNLNTTPVVCSTATIFLNVKPNPAPAPDFTTTVEGITVIDNAANNDLGVTGGTFAIVTQPTGGTVTIDPTSGQYTFVPTPSFTGVTTATYQLCNGAPVTCSTAVITITVYPMLVANNDVINTTPSVSVNGTLVTNDNGVITGGNYTITVAPIDPTVGVIVVDPITGGYTFTPDPAFTGTAVTVYTICNTSVNPIICSTATITINVFPNPVPANDDNVTIVGTPVTGNAAANDLGVTGGTFSIIAQPADGTVAIDPATGQYTYTPSPTFTGVVTATYQLCNGAPVTCSTAIITITVYPQLLAVADATNTGINTPVSGTLTVNDNGIVSNGQYTVTVSPVSTTQGTITVDPTTGQYTFVPATGFTGTVVTTYTICQYNGTVTLQCSSNTITISVGAKAAIGLAKKLADVTYHTDNTVSLGYKITVKNMGNQPLTSITVTDNLSAVINSPATFTVTVPPFLKASNGLVAESGFTGKGTNILLTNPATSTLAPGAADTLFFTVRVDAKGANGAVANTATVSAVGNGTNVTDNSTEGNDPDPDGNSDAGNNDTPTNFTLTPVKMGVAKFATAPVSVGGGCYTMEFKFTVKNLSNGPAFNIALFDNLDQVFGSISYSVIAAPRSSGTILLPDPSFTGSGNKTNLLLSSSMMQKGQTDTITFGVRFCVVGAASFSNIAVINANSMPGGGFTYTGTSMSGTDPDADNDNNQNEFGPTAFAPSPELFIPEGFSPNGDGINDVLVVRGINDYPLNTIRILNRWGNLVYEKQTYDNTWDGTSNTGLTYGGDQLPEGTYFYILETGDGQKAKTGFIYLNRSAKK